MDVALRRSDDLKTLETLYRRERNAKQRDRYRVVDFMRFASLKRSTHG